jgi:prolyl-tRNA editing enzyme YbaK/EbsC (Cys-tRNA(Pro) deacylase)
MGQLSSSAARVASALQRLGITTEVREMPASTRSAPEAAAAVGCDVGMIVKSLVFRSVDTGEAILVLASGGDRVDEGRLATVVGQGVQRADASFVRERTGYAIGGVPPLGHERALPTYLDERLLSHSVVWAAAGTPNAVFSIAPDELVRATSAKVVSVSVLTPPP